MDAWVVVVAQPVESIIISHIEIIAVIPVVRPRLFQHKPEAAVLKPWETIHNHRPAHMEPVFFAESLVEVVVRDPHNTLVLARLITAHVRLFIVRYLLRIAALMPAALRLVLLCALLTLLSA